MKSTPSSAEGQTQSTVSNIPDRLIRHTTLRQLQVFEAIVRLGSVTRAAEELFLTQPTASMQIKKLTDAMGLPLFEHVGRNVEPTEAGMELYEACCKVFDTLFNLEMKIDDLKGMKRGRLRIAGITMAKYLAPEILGEFSRIYPGIELALNVTNRERVIERMLGNKDDLYILGQMADYETEVEMHPFSPNPLVVLAPRDHPLVGRKNIPLEDIAKEPFIIREPGSGIRDATMRTFAAKGLQPKIRMELGSNEAIKHAIVGGLGLSVLSLHTLTLDSIDSPVAILDVEGFPIIREWYIVYPKSKELSLIAKTFLEFMKENEPIIRDRMKTTWPALKNLLDNKKKRTASRKKAAKKS
jgi:DNA-binding transcriptional LysR family regulator